MPEKPHQTQVDGLSGSEKWNPGETESENLYFVCFMVNKWKYLSLGTEMRENDSMDANFLILFRSWASFVLVTQ